MNPIDDVIIYMSKANNSRNEKIVYVTDLVRCSHYRVLILKNPQLASIVTPSTLIGSLLHEGLGKILGKLGYEVEVPIIVRARGVKVIGRIDAIDRDYIYEFKYSTDSEEPYLQHFLQLRIYLYMWYAVYGERKKGKLIYITPSGIREYYVAGPVSRDEFEKLVKETVEDRKAPRWRGECFKCPLYYYCDKARK